MKEKYNTDLLSLKSHKSDTFLTFTLCFFPCILPEPRLLTVFLTTATPALKDLVLWIWTLFFCPVSSYCTQFRIFGFVTL